MYYIDDQIYLQLLAAIDKSYYAGHPEESFLERQEMRLAVADRLEELGFSEDAKAWRTMCMGLVGSYGTRGGWPTLGE